MNKVKMRHDGIDGEIEVFESAVPVHMASGWVPVEPEPEQSKTTTTKKPAKE